MKPSLAHTNSIWDCIIKEAIEIKITDNTLNRDSSLQLNVARDPAIADFKTGASNTNSTHAHI